jgi:small subunit ribosomal protein S16
VNALKNRQLSLLFMLTLRLQRVGKRKQATYRLIVSEKKRDTQRGSLEILGTYNPSVEPKKIELNSERIQHWLSVGAQTSDTVHNILVDAGILKSEKRASVTISKKRKEKLSKAAAAATPAA